MRNVRKDKRVVCLLALPGLTVFTLVLPLPLLRTAMLSFYSWDVLEPAHFVGLANYRAIFTVDPVFRHALVDTVYLCAGSVVLQVPLAFVLAYWFGTGKVKGYRFFRNVFFFPVIVSGTAVGLLWNSLLQPNIGLVDGIIRAVGFHNFQYSWLASPTFAIWSVVVSISWQYFGYHMLIFSAGVTSLPASIVEAAGVDGAGEWRTLRSVVLPTMKPFLQVSLILILSSSVTIFANVLALTNGGPDNASNVLALYMYQESFFYQHYGYGSAIAVFLLVMNIVLLGGVSLLFSERFRLARLTRRRARSLSMHASPAGRPAGARG